MADSSQAREFWSIVQEIDFSDDPTIVEAAAGDLETYVGEMEYAAAYDPGFRKTLEESILNPDEVDMSAFLAIRRFLDSEFGLSGKSADRAIARATHMIALERTGIHRGLTDGQA